MKNILLISLFLTTFITAQNISFKIPDIKAIEESTIYIPVTVENLMNVGAITLVIEYDSNVLEWIEAINLNKDLEGALASIKNDKLVIAWDDVTGANIGSGTLLELKFYYRSGSTVLDFLEEECEIADINVSVLDVSYFNGSVNPKPACDLSITSPNGSEEYEFGESINLTWTGNSATSVKLELYKGDSYFQDIESNTANDRNYTWDSPNIIPGDDYKIRISDVDNGNCFDFSDSSFTVNFEDLFLISPENNVTINDPKPTFMWNEVEHATLYTIHINSTDDFSAPLIDEGVQTNEFTVLRELSEDTYFWRARAERPPFYGEWSPIRKFTIDLPEQLEPPQLEQPLNNSIIEDSTPFFNWTDVQNASSYEFQIGNNNDFSSPIITTIVNESEYTIIVPLEYDIYYWKVRSINSNESLAIGLILLLSLLKNLQVSFIS